MWYIYDPVFSFIQRGMKSGGTGYRVGYVYRGDDQTVRFYLVHSPILAKLFKRNLTLPTMVEVIRSTSEYRIDHFGYRSSKQAVRPGRDGDSSESCDLENFVDQLKKFDQTHDPLADMFPARRSTGKEKGRSRVGGHTFYLLLAEKARMIRSGFGVARLVGLTWPLFLCLYPTKPKERRAAGLARSMRVRGIPKVCEFPSIRVPSLQRRSSRGPHQARFSRRLGSPREWNLAMRISSSRDGGQVIRSPR